MSPEDARAEGSPPLVSVVIPCHNYGRFLGSAIESVLRQTYPSSELIVIDDGSTDDSIEVAAGYPDAMCIRQDNLGQAAAQNRGLEMARGELVLFLDADDELLPDALKTLARCLGTGSGCAFAYGHVQLVDAEGAPLPARASRSSRLQTCVQGDAYAQMLRTNNSLRSSGAVLYRADVLRGVGGFALDVGNAQDLDVNLRLAREHPISCNDRIVLTKRLHDANSMLRFGPMLRGSLVAQRRQRGFVRRHPEYRRDYRTGLGHARSYWGSHLARRVLTEARAGDLRGAAGDLGTLIRYAPRAGAAEFRKILLGR